MRISLQWLGEWIGGPLPAPKGLAARLTMAGLEVEGVEAAAPPLPGVTPTVPGSCTLPLPGSCTQVRSWAGQHVHECLEQNDPRPRSRCRWWSPTLSGRAAHSGPRSLARSPTRLRDTPRQGRSS